MDKKFCKTLAHIAIPIIIQEFLNSFVNILDTFMIGSLGVKEITAVGLANQVFFLFILFVFGINSGAAILMGQYWGSKDVKSIKKTLGICLCGSLAAAVAFSSFALFAPEIIMGIYSKDPDVIRLGSEYLGTIWITYILTAMSLSLSTALKSTRQTKIPMFTTFIALSCNAVFNYIFIYILHLGVVGAALGTVIARLIELVALVTIVYAGKLPVAASFKELFAANKKFIKYFLTVAFPVIMNESVWAIGISIYNVAYKYCGTDAQGALQIASSVQTLFMVIGIGVGSACGIMISNTLGEGDIDKAIKYSRKFMKLSFAVSIPMCILLILCAPAIANIFNVSYVVKDYAIKTMIVVAVAIVARMFTYTTIVGILRNGGDVWFCLCMDMISVWFIGIPIAFFGAKILQLPIYYVVALVTLEEVLKVFVSGYRVMKNGWARKLV